MTVERVAGLGITIGYTILVLIAIQPGASGGVIDAVPWIAALFMILVYGLYLISDRTVVQLHGGHGAQAIRGISIGIQLFALYWVGWWWTLAMRILTEFMSGYRVWWATRRLKMSFKVDRDERDERFIHCYQCGYDSYNVNDIKELYCGHCNKFHHDSDGVLT